MYLKIVPATGVEAETYIIECDRVSYKVEEGAATEVHKTAECFNSPGDVDLTTSTISIGYTREVMEPGASRIAAGLFTVHRDGKPPTRIVAYECSAFMMNPAGQTIDRVSCRKKF